MTWESFLTLLRIYLEDTSTAPRWADDLLMLYTVDAVYDYSRWFPRRIDQLEMTVSNGNVALPTDCLDIIDVECPRYRYLRQRQETPGRKYNKRSEPTYYFIENSSLYLDSDYNDKVYVTYQATHTIPSSTDTEFEFSIPDMDLELIRLYVKGQIHIQMRTKTARLDRFEVGGGRRDDNPLMPETIDIMKEYYRKINDRIRGGAIKLYKAGR